MDLSLRFKWQTMDRRVLTIQEMDTNHIFNCMKMEFNHLAVMHEDLGLTPVMFQNVYQGKLLSALTDPAWKARQIAFFAWHIQQRGDLDEWAREPYQDMLLQLLGIGLLHGTEDAPTPADTDKLAAPERQATIGSRADTYWRGAKA